MNKNMNRLMMSALLALGTVQFATTAWGAVTCGAGNCIGEPNAVIVDTNVNGIIEPGTDQDITTTRGANWVDIHSPWECNPFNTGVGNRVQASVMDGNGVFTFFDRIRSSSHQIAQVDPNSQIDDSAVYTRFTFQNQGSTQATGFMEFGGEDDGGVFHSVRIQLNGTTAEFPLVEQTDGNGNRYISYGWGRTANFTNVRSSCGPTRDGRVMIPQIWLRLAIDPDTNLGQVVFDADNDGNQDDDAPASPPLEGIANGNVFFALFPPRAVPTFGQLAMLVLVLSLVFAGWSTARSQLVEERTHS